MMVQPANDNLFRRLAARASDARASATDPRFRTNGDRVIHRTELVPILADIFATERRAYWAELPRPGRPFRTADQ